MRKVLVVSYAFPPQYDVSARRAAKLCKYLPATGWQPVVLTKDWTRDVAAEDRRAFTVVSYPDALGELPGLSIIRAPYSTHDNALRRLHERLGGVYNESNGITRGRTRALAPRSIARRALSLVSPTFGDFPDGFRGWVNGAVQCGVDAVRRMSIDAIYSLCPPATAHVVASEIARQTGVPWIAQFDDLFSFHVERPARRLWRWHAHRAHTAWLRRADSVTATTPAMLDYLRRTYGLDGEVLVVGFDPDAPSTAHRARGDLFTLAYTGSVYLGDQQPALFFEALELLLASLPEDRRRIEVTFAGTNRIAELREQLTRFPLASRACTFIERLAPEEALGLQRRADALILLNCTVLAPEHGTLSFPSKVFEYLHARRPILAMPRDPGGLGDSLLQSTRAGVAADTATEAASILRSWIDSWSATGTVPYAGVDAEIAKYSQPNQAGILGRLLDRAVAQKGHRER